MRTFRGPKAIAEASQKLGNKQLVILHHVPTRKTEAVVTGGQGAYIKIDNVNEWVSFVCQTPMSAEELKAEIQMRREWRKAA